MYCIAIDRMNLCTVPMESSLFFLPWSRSRSQNLEPETGLDSLVYLYVYLFASHQCQEKIKGKVAGLLDSQGKGNLDSGTR